MRFHLLSLVLLAGIATPALAQRDPVERRVERLEQELRAVQRRVFPRGAGATVEPEISPAAPAATPSGATGSAVADLTARVDALEAQLARLTGQGEENANRLRQIDEALARLRTETAAPLDGLEQRSAQAAPAPAATAPAEQPAQPTRAEPAPTAAAADPALAPSTGDPIEDAYTVGFRLWEQRRYAEAQRSLEAFVARYPNHRRTSWASNLAGRAYLDDNKPATAARLLLANYQGNPRGERAADSLFFLGEALVRLDRKAEACRVYDELQEVYPNMRDWLRQRLPAARTAAQCRSTF
jgi:TolA-binding protein